MNHILFMCPSIHICISIIQIHERSHELHVSIYTDIYIYIHIKINTHIYICKSIQSGKYIKCPSPCRKKKKRSVSDHTSLEVGA